MIGPLPLIGSSWDVAAGPDRTLPHHLAEWVEGSAVHPELAAANLQTLAGSAVIEALAGDRLEQLGAHAQQYATAPVVRLLQALEPVAAAGGWWCSGLDPLADWAPMSWGQLKPDAPRRDADGKVIKLEAPWGPPTRSIWLRVPAVVAQLVADRHRLPLPAAVAADHDGRAGAFWRWWAVEPRLPLVVAEGPKKAGALLSLGLPTVALPGIDSGAKRNGPPGSDGRRTGPLELIPDLAALPLAGRRVMVLFDHSSKAEPREPIAARHLARLLLRAGAREALAGTVPGTHGKGADDHIVNGGTWEQLAAALAPLGPEPVLPRLRAADRIAPAGPGHFLGVSCPLPSPELAPLVILKAPMGCGKTEAIAQALAPLAAAGVPILMPSHRQALGQAAAERVGVPWCPVPGSDERQQGVAGCWDSWCPSSHLQISGHSWSGAALVLDEWAQAVEHLLFSTGTALADRRAEVLRTAADQLPRMRQTIAADAQMPEWAVRLLERLTGRRALVIRSEHQPMAGRPLHCPEGFGTPAAAATAFRAQWAQLVIAGRPFLCWTSAQRAGMNNAPQTLAAVHRQWCPEARVLVIDSTTPEAAAELAADPDGVAEQWDAIYCSPSISSGISFQRWKPAAVIAYAGGRIAPEHAAQALARVRSPEVPAYLFAPEGGALKVASRSTEPAELIRHLQAVTDPLFGQLQAAGEAWLEAWSEAGAHRNRQRHAYRATIAGLLQAEGWELQAPGPEPCPAAGAKAAADLAAIAKAALAAEYAAVIAAPQLEPEAAAALKRRRRRTPEERAALQRHQLIERWALGTAAPSLQLLEADRDGLRDRLRLGWILATPEALALIPGHDQQRIAALDPTGQPFAPDRLRVTLGPKVAALIALGLPQLLARFSAGEVIAANDPAVMQLHTTATAHRAQLVAATGCSPGKLPTGTLRALLQACGWELQRVGRIKARGAGRDALTYRAQLMALPEGVTTEALAAAWLAELQAAATGALFSPTWNLCRGQKCPTLPDHGPPPPHRPSPWGRVVPIPWAAALRTHQSVPLAA
ncbi:MULTISPECIES: DUF3854 domain-containing protein [unclassified Cyanobium]|uniref:DUF3854 domain-containing protein n=1 Tax=unclassified Cyanobium TaxID=2627006 RepID=UPI0020CC21A2|nr:MULTISPECIES: DUF3854 domain-containing protein [unclassified Cyanobium]MCP9861086.1 DUF3854 domain-containing protein [Cyanobium sp. Cruz-8H5]MCP9868320.1 DUF3854 domain-containing protein [Cyanobium sp. Cruz-8D1]